MPEAINLRYVNPNSKNLTARITSISPFGEVEILFNASIDLGNGIEYFKDHMTIKIVPADDRQVNPRFKWSELEFTWNIT